MAVALESVDFIVPISRIRHLYPGGWTRCLADLERASAIPDRGAVTFDEHLLRIAIRDPDDLAAVFDRWVALGFEPTAERDRELVWKDCCIVDAVLGGLALPCDWLELSPQGDAAWLAGTETGLVHDEALAIATP